MPLGGYTLAEIDAVSGVIHFLEREPPPELVAEAVRSLAARSLITTSAGSDQVQVRGDLGIALALQHRAHAALISVSHWEDDGARETHDVVLAQDGERCHVFLRDPEEPTRLVAQGPDDEEWRDLVTRLAVPRQVA